MSLATEERELLCDTLDLVGPDRPTLCAGWSTRDLLAHLLMRERQPWAAPGILVPSLAPITEKAMRAYDDERWDTLVGQLRDGAPVWSPYRIAAVDTFVNGAEFFVHHEDVRRGEAGWEPRAADATRDGEFWQLLVRAGRVLYRRSPTGVVIQRPASSAHPSAQHVVSTGSGVVTIVGEPGELVLHAFGRDVARVEVRGLREDVEAFAAAPRGV